MRSAAPAIALLLLSCGRREPVPPPAIDPAMAACVPTDAAGLAGLNLEALRRSPLLAAIPPVDRAFLDSFRDARSVLVASQGSELLTVVRVSLAGWTAAAGGLSLNGSPNLIRAATARHTLSALLAVAEPMAARNPVWVVVR